LRQVRGRKSQHNMSDSDDGDFVNPALLGGGGGDSDEDDGGFVNPALMGRGDEDEDAFFNPSLMGGGSDDDAGYGGGSDDETADGAPQSSVDLLSSLLADADMTDAMRQPEPEPEPEPKPKKKKKNSRRGGVSVHGHFDASNAL
jgi:hypothetical protein